jgi:DNA-binding NtrC family response regulator
MSLKIFVVDDEKWIAQILSDFLREAYLDVETFYDAHSVLQRMSDCLPDVLVSDITMPDMDGIELVEALLKKCPNCKVILMSGNPGWRTHKYLERDDWHRFTLLRKPFPLSQLLDLIKSEAE